MGSGFRDFAVNEVLTAANVNNYLMTQSVMSFSSTGARDSALSGSLEEGMVAYTRADNTVWVYDTTSWVPLYSPWTSFTPAYANCTEGNAFNAGHYCYVNGDLHVRTRFVFGSTSSISSTMSMTLPNGETSLSDNNGSVGSVIVLDAGSRLYVGSCYVPANSTVVTPFVADGSGYVINATSPMTWVAGDELRMQIVVAL